MKRSTYKWILSVLLSVCLASAGCSGADTSSHGDEQPVSQTQAVEQESSDVTAPSSWASVPASSSAPSSQPSVSSRTSSKSESSSSHPASVADSSVAAGTEIPDLTGVDINSAQAKLKALGIKTEVNQEYSNTVKAGKIIRQSVRMGTSDQEQIIVLYESLGKNPDVSSKPSAPAESSAPESSASEAGEREVESISLNVSELTLTVGQTFQLQATLSPSNASDPTFYWSWSDEALATLNPEGILTAKAPGTLTVQAVTANQKKAVCAVTIIEKTSRPESSASTETQSIVNYTVPYHSATVYEDIDALCKRYPELMSQYTLGWSTKGKAIPCIVMGHGSKKGCIAGGIHSREHITVSFVMRSVEEMAKAYTENELYGEYDLRELLNKYTLYIVPMMNPDGTDIATAGELPLVDYPNFSGDSYKDNANGVNLNRNFPYHWDLIDQSINDDGRNNHYYGTHAGSEKETQAMMSLCNSHSFEWLLDMHIVGNGIYWYDQLNGRIPNDSTLTHAIASRCEMQEFPMTYATAFGGFENWFRYTFQKPGLCVELIPYSQSDRSRTYYGLNSFFDDAVNWESTKYIFPESMRVL